MSLIKVVYNKSYNLPHTDFFFGLQCHMFYDLSNYLYHIKYRKEYKYIAYV